METALKRKVSWGEAAQATVSAFETVLGLDLQLGNLTPDEKKPHRRIGAGQVWASVLDGEIAG